MSLISFLFDVRNALHVCIYRVRVLVEFSFLPCVRDTFIRGAWMLAAYLSLALHVLSKTIYYTDTNNMVI